ncbi:hypothetical protein MYAM1_003761 [Malassezia yamatoensis]|uniref:Uncharacterized protein n=1 Tax=Malassezia yamatoensis TaxID=253288 RepID=A0AAJ5YWR1_9BASI|nr:hypothetical protein MYAM1_003761 [Malassezia yamatoensis]
MRMRMRMHLHIGLLLVGYVYASWGWGSKRFKEEGIVEVGSLGLESGSGTLVAWAHYNPDRFLDAVMMNANRTSLAIHPWNHHTFQFEKHAIYQLTVPTGEQIVNVVPADFTYDGRADLLVMTENLHASKTRPIIYMRLWPSVPDGFADPIRLPDALHAQPLTLDATGLLRGDLLGHAVETHNTSKLHTESMPLTIWRNEMTNNNTFVLDRTKLHLDENLPQCELGAPHFSATVDLDGDCLADLFLVCANADSSLYTYQIWLASKNESVPYQFHQSGSLPQNVGPISFADMNRDGTIDLVFSTCERDRCKLHIAYNRQIPLCESNPSLKPISWPWSSNKTSASDRGKVEACRDPQDLCVADNQFHLNLTISDDNALLQSMDLEALTGDPQLLTKDDIGASVPAPVFVRIGDINLDGYPDLLLLTIPKHRRPSETRVRLLESIECLPRSKAPGCDSLHESQLKRRSFQLVRNTALDQYRYVRSAALVDLDEDGTLDILLQSYEQVQILPSAARRLTFFQNNDFHDAFFLKALTLNGACRTQCEPPNSSSFEPWGAGLGGASYKFTVLDPNGVRRAQQVMQQPQTVYNALLPPSAFIGLGRTNNYVESLFVGSTRRQTQPYVAMEGVIPNSEVVVSPWQDQQSPLTWHRELFLHPADWIPVVTAALIALITLLGTIVYALNLNENREDQRERQRAVGSWDDWHAEGRFSWLYLLLIPLVILILNHLLVPLIASALLPGRLTFSFVSLLAGVHNLTYYRPNETKYAWQIRRIYPSLHLPRPWSGAHGRSRLRLISVCIDGLHVNHSDSNQSTGQPAQAASHKAAQEHQNKHQADHQRELAYEAHLRRLIDDQRDVDREPVLDRESSAFRAFLDRVSSEIRHSALSVARYLQPVALLIAQYCIALWISIVALEVQNVSIHLAQLDVDVGIENIRLNGSNKLAYQRRAKRRASDIEAMQSTQSFSDGFHDGPENTSACHQSIFGRLYGQVHLHLEVGKMQALQSQSGTKVARSDGAWFSTRVLLSERIRSESTALQLGLKDTTLFLDGLLAVQQAISSKKAAKRSREQDMSSTHRIPTQPEAAQQGVHEANSDPEHATSGTTAGTTAGTTGDTSSGTPSGTTSDSQASSPKRAPTKVVAGLAMLKSIDVQIDAVHLHKQAPDGYLQISIRNTHAGITNSDPGDPIHQVWFGGCGVQNKKLALKTHSRATLKEARQIWKCSAEIEQVEVCLRGSHPATLLRIQSLTSWMRFSYTPWGVLPKYTKHHGAPAFFADDPNEPTIVTYVGIEQIRGAPDYAALHSLKHAIDRFQMLKRSFDQHSSSTEPATKSMEGRQRPKPSPPRLALVLHMDSVLFMIHASQVSLQRPSRWDEHGSALVFSVPKLHCSIQGGYTQRLGNHRKIWTEGSSAQPEESAPIGVAGLGGSAPYAVPTTHAKQPTRTVPDPVPLPHQGGDHDKDQQRDSPVYETAPWQYRMEASAGFELLEVYLSGAHPSTESQPARVLHDDLVQIQSVECTYHARLPASVDFLTWKPKLQFDHHKTRIALSIHRIEVDLWQEHVLQTLSTLIQIPFGDPNSMQNESHEELKQASHGSPNDAPTKKPSSASDPPRSVFSRMPNIGLLHLGIGSSSLYLGSNDPNDQPEVRRGVGLVLGQTTLDYGRDTHTPHQHARRHARHEASKEARTALRLPEHIASRALNIAHQYRAGAALDLAQFDFSVYPLVDMRLARRHGDFHDVSPSPTNSSEAGKPEKSAWQQAADNDPFAQIPQNETQTESHSESRKSSENTESAQKDSSKNLTGMDNEYPLHIASADTPLEKIAPGSPHGKQVPAEQDEPNGPALPLTPTVAPYTPDTIPVLPAHPGSEQVSTRELYPGAIASKLDELLLPGEINVSITPPRTPPMKRGTALYSTDAWSFDDAFVPLMRAVPYYPKMRQLDPSTHIVAIPQLNVHGTGRPPNHGPELYVEVRSTHPVSFRMRLLHTYCILIAISGVRFLRPTRKPREESPSATKSSTPFPKNSIEIHAGLPTVHLHAFLPADREVFVSISDVEVRYRNPRAIRVSFALLHAAVPSAQHGLNSYWEEAATIRRLAVSCGEQEHCADTLFFTGDCFHFRIPYAFNTHLLVEGCIVAFKASKQLVYQLVQGQEGSAIYPHPEEPKKLPPISIRMRMACLEAADNAFDSRLALIYLAGSDEHLMRLERERVFQQRVKDKQLAGEELDQAYERLQALNASMWIRRFQNASNNRKSHEQALLGYINKRTLDPHKLHYDTLPIAMFPTSCDPPLCRIVMTQLCVDVTQPKTFPLDKTHEFLQEHGGDPLDLKYTTLIPVHLRLRLSEASVRLRDYPVPLLHIPPWEDFPDPAKPSLDCEGELCVAEQLGIEASVRHVAVTVIPALQGQDASQEQGLLVPKSVMTPTLYGAVTVHVGTTTPTHFAWGQSMQPAIQDLIRVIDCLTSPPHDPSPKLGPWDKLPFQLQAKLHLVFAAEARLHLKGSRDPYQVSGAGSGWMLIWRDHVEVRAGFPNDDQEFLQIISGEHLLAIPDLEFVMNPYQTGLQEYQPNARECMDQLLARQTSWTTPELQKVAWHLHSGVRWGMGLVPERTCTESSCKRHPKCEGAPFDRQCRFFGRIPHWKVITKSKEGIAKLPQDQRTDSFAGWRSDFVHLSVSLQAIGDTADDPKANPNKDSKASQRSDTVNNLYITPLAWDYFWEWKNLFNSALSLPIRQGPVFPRPPGQKSPKFGLHLATIKYRFNLSPLYITHMYRQRIRYDLAHGLRTFLGVKALLGTFYLDLHQRMQETIHESPNSGEKPIRAFHKPLYEAEADLSDLALYSIAAQFREQFASTPGLSEERDEKYDLFREYNPDPSETSIEDPLYDPKDYVELDDVPLADDPPRLRIHQALALTRFHFHRLVESRRDYMKREQNPEESRQRTRSKFGKECTHTCLIGSAHAVMDEQFKVAQRRVNHLHSDLEASKAMRSPGNADESQFRYDQRIASLEDNYARLREQLELAREHRVTEDPMKDLPQPHVNLLQHALSAGDASQTQCTPNVTEEDPLCDEWDSFNNRILIDNPVGMLSNYTRDLLARYYSSSKLHRRFAQRLSVTEQQELRDLLERSIKVRQQNAHQDQDEDPVEMLDHIVSDTVRLASQHGGLPQDFVKDFGAESSEEHAPDDGISNEYVVRKNTICLCTQPQLVLHSTASKNSTLIFHAKQLRVRNYAVSDEQYMDNSRNRNVLHRNYIGLQSLECFHSTRALNLVAQRGLRSLAVPSSILNHGKQDSRHFRRVIRETHALVLYDKHNQNRMQDLTRPVLASGRQQDLTVNYLAYHMDLVRVLCPKFILNATTDQYAAIYTVVTDLLLYTDPYAQEYAQQRSSFAYSYNFDQPEALLALVSALQLHAHDLLKRRRVFEMKFDELNRAGQAEYVRISAEFLDQYLELCLIEEAVRISNSSRSDKEKQYAMLLQTFAESIEWNMIGDPNFESDAKHAGSMLVRLALSRVSFARLGLASGTSTNSLTLGDLRALNAHPSAYFEEMISKYQPTQQDHSVVKQDAFLSTAWLLLPSTGGIATIDRFEFHMHPVRVQLELKIGKQLMDYLFGQNRTTQDQEEDSGKQVSKPARWYKRILHPKLSSQQESSSSQSDANDHQDTDADANNEDDIDDDSLMSPSQDTQDHLPVTHYTAKDNMPSAASSMHHDQNPNLAGRKTNERKEDDSASLASNEFHDDASLTSSRSQDPVRGFSLSNLGRSGRADTDSDQDSVALANVEYIRNEMAKRSADYVSFVQVVFNELTICLSYKGDGDHALTNLYDLEFHTPKLEYTNQLASYRNLADSLKRDMIRIAWKNRNTLIKGVMATNNKKRQALKRIRERRLLKYNDSADDPRNQLQRIGEEGLDDLDSLLDAPLEELSSHMHRTRSTSSSQSAGRQKSRSDSKERRASLSAHPSDKTRTEMQPPDESRANHRESRAAPPIVISSLYGIPSNESANKSLPNPAQSPAESTSIPTHSIETKQEWEQAPTSAPISQVQDNAPTRQTSMPSLKSQSQATDLDRTKSSWRKLLHLPKKRNKMQPSEADIQRESR